MCFSTNHAGDANNVDNDVKDCVEFEAIIFKCTSMKSVQFISLQANDPQDLPSTVFQ